MSKTYVVQAGDTLSGIAQRNGYTSWRVIYFDADNMAFRTKRPNPNLILPGDVVALPNATADIPVPMHWTFNPSPTRLNLFLDPADRLRLGQIIMGPLPGPTDPLRDLEKALKQLGPSAQSSNTLEELANKIQKHIQITAGDWTIKPDLATIGKGLLELLKKVK